MLASLVAVAALGAVFLGSTGTASAAKVNCSGSLVPDPDNPKSKVDLDYKFSCDQDVLALTITFSKSVILFDPEVLAVPTSGEGGELVSCEGKIPTKGLGCTAQSAVCPSATSTYTQCTGTVPAGHVIEGGFETEKPFCPKPKRKKNGDLVPRKPFSATASVSTLEKTASGKSFVQSSEPFGLARGFKCPKPKK